MQLGLISTSTLNVVIETSLVSPVETKQVRKVDLNWTCFSVHTRQNGTISYRFCSHENGTVRYRIVPSFGSLFRTTQFLDLFWNGLLDFFPYPCEHNPSPYHFLERTRVEQYDIVPVWTGPKLISKHGSSISHSCFNYPSKRISGLFFSKALTWV